MPLNYQNYHPDWKDVIRPEALKRAQYKCQNCGVPNRSLVIRSADGTWFEADEWLLSVAREKKIKITKIHLQVAHLNHDRNNNLDENLRVLCQKCHLNYDENFRLRNRRTKGKNLL